MFESFSFKILSAFVFSLLYVRYIENYPNYKKPVQRQQMQVALSIQYVLKESCVLWMSTNHWVLAKSNFFNSKVNWNTIESWFLLYNQN